MSEHTHNVALSLQRPLSQPSSDELVSVMSQKPNAQHLAAAFRSSAVFAHKVPELSDQRAYYLSNDPSLKLFVLD